MNVFVQKGIQQSISSTTSFNSHTSRTHQSSSWKHDSRWIQLEIITQRPEHILQNILHNVLEISFFSHLFHTPSSWSTDSYLVVQSTECLVVLLQCGQQLLLSENGSQGLVLTFKAQSNKTIPFLHCSFLNNKCPYSEVDWRRRIQRLNTNNPGFNLLICNTSMNDIPLVEDWSSSLKPSGPAELWKATAYSQTIGSTYCHWA